MLANALFLHALSGLAAVGLLGSGLTWGASPTSKCAALLDAYLVVGGPLASKVASHALSYADERSRNLLRNKRDHDTDAEQFKLEFHLANLKTAQAQNEAGMALGFHNRDGFTAHMANHFYDNAAMDIAGIKREIKTYTEGTPSAPFYEAYPRSQGNHLYSPLTGDFVLEHLPLGESYLAFRQSETKVEPLPDGKGYRISFITSKDDTPLKDLVAAAELWKLGSIGGNAQKEMVREVRSKLTLQARSPSLPALDPHQEYISIAQFNVGQNGVYSLEITILLK